MPVLAAGGVSRETSMQGDINFGIAGHGSVIDFSTSVLKLTSGVPSRSGRSAAPSTPTTAPGTLVFTYDPQNPVPTFGSATVVPHSPPGSFDQRVVEERDDVLVFTTDVLTASLTAATDGPTTDWVVRLCGVHPDGRSYNVVEGITRVEIVSGEASTVEVDLWSTSMLFKRGHRIRVQVTSSCFPRWDRNLNTVNGLRTGEMRVASQTLHVGGDARSFVTLPIV